MDARAKWKIRGIWKMVENGLNACDLLYAIQKEQYKLVVSNGLEKEIATLQPFHRYTADNRTGYTESVRC